MKNTARKNEISKMIESNKEVSIDLEKSLQVLAQTQSR